MVVKPDTTDSVNMDGSTRANRDKVSDQTGVPDQTGGSDGSNVSDDDGGSDRLGSDSLQRVLCKSCRTELGWSHEDGEAQIRAEKAIPVAGGEYVCVRCWASWYKKRFVAKKPKSPNN